MPNFSSNPNGIGQRIGDWLTRLWEWYANLPVIKPVLTVIAHVTGQIADNPSARLQALARALAALNTPSGNVAAIIASYLATGTVTDDLSRGHALLQSLRDNPQRALTIIRDVMRENPPSEAAARDLGRLITSVALRPTMAMIERGRENVEDAAETIIGYATGINLSLQLIGLLVELLGVGQLQSVATMLTTLASTLGLDTLSHQILSPMINRAYGDFAGRYYNAKYRPNRWSVPELIQLYGLRKISRSQFVQRMREHGYLDDDIDIAAQLADKDPRASYVEEGLQYGIITPQQAADMLFEAGYGADGVAFLLRIYTERRRQRELDSIGQVAIQAYRKGIISDAQYLDMRRAARVPEDRIRLEQQLVALDKEVETKTLSASTIKSAYRNNVLARQEAIHYLLDAGYDTRTSQIMLDTWDEEARPKALRINASTIVSAYKHGVIDRTTANRKLTDIGWSDADAELHLAVADDYLRSSVKRLSDYAIVQAYEDGIITYDDALARLVSYGYTDADARMYMRLSTLAPTKPDKTLTKTEVVNLYEKQIISYYDAIEELIRIGYNQSVAELVLIANASNIKGLDDIPTGG